MKSYGFTVFEVMVVVGIFLIVILASWPSISTSQQGSLLRRETRTLLNDLRLAQQLTVGQQTTNLIKLIDSSPDKYQLISRTETDTIIKEHLLNSKVSWQNMGGFTNNEIVFTLSGAAIQAGTIILQNTNGLTNDLEIKPSGYVKIN